MVGDLEVGVAGEELHVEEAELGVDGGELVDDGADGVVFLFDSSIFRLGN